TPATRLRSAKSGAYAWHFSTDCPNYTSKRDLCRCFRAPRSTASDIEQAADNLTPFFIQGKAGHRLSGSPVPVSGIAGVALLAMKIGMDPTAGGILLGLSTFMRLVPVPLGIPPQGLQGQAQAFRWLVGRLRILEGAQIHLRILVEAAVIG